MSTWSPSSSVVTNVGNTLLANARVGLGTIRLTKVVSRENFESTVATMKSYTSESITAASIAQTGHIMNCRAVAHPDPTEPVETSLVTVRFSNDELEDPTTGYNLRQIILFAELIDPSTEEVLVEECPYMVSQCDSSSDCDVMPAFDTNPTAFDYDMYVIHAGVDDFTIEVRTEGFVWQEDFDDYKDEVELEFEALAIDVDSRIVGQRNMGRTFSRWLPTYDSSHDNWNTINGGTVTGQGASESYNQEHLSNANGFATGQRSTSFGKNTEVLSNNSLATGDYNFVMSDNSFASGKRNAMKSGYNNFISGEQCEIESGNNNAIFGFANALSNEAYSTLMSGHHLKGGSVLPSVIFGRYNLVDSQSDYALIIGNGHSDNNRANLFTVKWNGQVASDSVRVNSIYVDKIYNLDGTEKDIGGGGGIDQNLIRRGAGVQSIITNDVNGNKSTGSYASTFGRANKAAGFDSVAFGESNESNGRNAVVMGSTNVASGNNSIVGGEKNSTSSSLNVILGTDESTVDGTASRTVVLGSSTVEVSNADSSDGFNFVSNSGGVELTDSSQMTILGSFTALVDDSKRCLVKGGDLEGGSVVLSNSEDVNVLTSGYNSINNTKNSFVAGDNATVNYTENSVILGSNLKVEGTSDSKIRNQTVIGKYNKNDSTKSFILGNGTNSARHNALTIDDQGNIYCNESETSLNTVINGAIQSTEKGTAGGVAELDSQGKVPISQIPGAVAQMLEGYYYNDKFYTDSAHTQEVTPNESTIYVDIPSSQTYRWSGSQYTIISESLALGETSSTAYRGDRGKTAYDHATDNGRLTTAQTTSKLYKFTTTAEGHIASVSDIVSGADVGLGNVTNNKQMKAMASAPTNNAIPLLNNSDTASLTDSQITIESGSNYSPNNDNKIPTSRSIAQNIAKHANLANYQATSETTFQNLSDGDTITDAFEKVQNNAVINKNNILLIQDHYKYDSRILFEQEAIPTGTIADGSTWIDSDITYQYKSTTNIVGGVIEKGSWNTQTKTKSDSTNRCRLSNSITLSAGATYTATLVSRGINNARLLLQYRSAGGGVVSESGWQSTFPYTFTAPSNCIGATIIFSNSGDTVCNPCDFGKLQINAGSTALTYEEPSWKSKLPTIASALVDCINKGAKNMATCDIESGSYQDGNVIVTNNGDGTFTVNTPNGAISSNAVIPICARPSNAVNGVTYAVSGCPSTGSSSTYYLQWEGSGSNLDTGSGSIVTITASYGRLMFVALSGSVLNNITFKPMICTEAEYKASQTYQPYAMNNVELTEQKADASDVPSKLERYIANTSKTYTLASNTPYIITVNSYGTYGMFMAFKYSDETTPRLYEIKKSSSFDSLITVTAVSNSSDISIAPVSSSTWYVSSGMKL